MSNLLYLSGGEANHPILRLLSQHHGINIIKVLEHTDLVTAAKQHQAHGILFFYHSSLASTWLTQIETIGVQFSLPVFCGAHHHHIPQFINQSLATFCSIIDLSCSPKIHAHNINQITSTFKTYTQQRVIDNQITREAQHRIKNNLSTLEGMLILNSMQSAHIGEQLAYRGASTKVALIKELNHRLLKDGGHTLNVFEYLQGVVQNIQRIMDTPPKAIRIEHPTKALLIAEKTAVSLGLIVNELLTNAIKYACSHKSQGPCVWIYMQLTKASDLEITISDNGPGFDTTAPTATAANTDGLSLIKSICVEMGFVFNIQSKPNAGTTALLRIEAARLH